MKENAETKFRVVFSAIFELTESYFQVSRRMSDAIEAYFITSTQATYGHLLARGVPAERILHVGETRARVRAMGEPGPELRQRIDAWEKFGFSFSSIILMSRFYNGEDAPSLMYYMAVTAARMEEFFLRHRIQCVVAEPTSAVELLTGPVARKNGILFCSIGFARLPHNRLLMFSDEEEREFYPLAQADDAALARARQEAELWLQRYRQSPVRPAYYVAQTSRRSPAGLLRAGIRQLKLLLDGLRSRDELNTFRFFDLVALHGRPYLDWFKRRIIGTQPETGRNQNRPYAVLYLHVCPERSVDVVASWFSNQLEVIRNIRRALPSRFDLLVKEHPSATGGQTLSFYTELKRIPNLRLVDAHFDSRQLMRGSAVVFTISGTPAYEAALLNVPAIIFSQVYFRRLPLVFPCSAPRLLPELIREALAAPRQSDDRAEVDFLADILLHSVESGWNGAAGTLPDEVIDSFAKLLHSTLIHTLIQTAHGAPLQQLHG